jgi:hypothetical protein
MEIPNPSTGVAFPHRSAMTALLVSEVAAIVIIESTAASRWIAESGFIHLVAISFVALAFGMAVRLRSMIVMEFRQFLKRMLFALAILGFSHAVEYLIDVKEIVDPRFAPLFVAAFYTVAIAVMITAASALLRIAGEKMHVMRMAAGTAALAPVAVILLAFSSGATGDELAPLFAVAFVALSVCAAYAAECFSRVGRHFPVLSLIVKYVNFAVLAVMLSGIAELASLFLEHKLPIPEWSYENVSHYVFYTGLTILYLAFDLPNHFGGIFADMRRRRT